MHASTDTPGRTCPLHYRYPARAFERPAELRGEVLYVVGGLYGNLEAWQALLGLLEAERGAAACKVTMVLNGDFHWFDAEPGWFAAIEQATAGHVRLRGNVETEIADPAPGAGCGCAYPSEVSDAVVERSNRIIDRLRAAATPAAAAALGALPMHAVAQVGHTRWGLVHGDAQSLAGWSFDAAALASAQGHARAVAMLREAGVDGFACSHTCAPALRGFEVDGRERLIVNNGAAGMPNFRGEHCGLVTRIALTAPPAALPVRYGRRLGSATAQVHVHALALHYDRAAFERRFLALWPEGSDAHASYYARIRRGPDFDVEQALGGAALAL